MTTALSARLVLIDGLPGSGKSTTAHLLARQFGYHGLPARWFYEQEEPHPVHTAGEGDPAWFVEQSLRTWRSFADRARLADEITILESSFFQEAILTLVRHDADMPAIEAYADARQAAIAALRPALIYFYQPDVATAMRTVCTARGPDWQDYFTRVLTENRYARRVGLRAFEGALTFMQHYRAICDTLFARFAGPKLGVENGAGDWASDYRRIMAFFGLPLVEEPAIRPDDARPFVGAYQDERSDFRCEVRFETGRLAVDRIWWPAARFAPLLPGTEMCFEIMGSPVELRFERDEAGRMSMRVGGRWQRCAGVGAPAGTVLWKQ